MRPQIHTTLPRAPLGHCTRSPLFVHYAWFRLGDDSVEHFHGSGVIRHVGGWAGPGVSYRYAYPCPLTARALILAFAQKGKCEDFSRVQERCGSATCLMYWAQ